MQGAAVPSALLVAGDVSRPQTLDLVDRFTAHIESESAARSLSLALSEIQGGPRDWERWRDVQLRGDPGMDREARVAFAARTLQSSVAAANRAFQGGDFVAGIDRARACRLNSPGAPTPPLDPGPLAVRPEHRLTWRKLPALSGYDPRGPSPDHHAIIGPALVTIRPLTDIDSVPCSGGRDEPSITVAGAS